MTGDQALAPLVEDYLDIQYDAIVVGERALRGGRLEFVHPTRVASRRYRTVLRDMQDLFDSAASIVLEESLRWYAALLGQVRDVQIARDELVAALEQLPQELVVGPAAEVMDYYLAARERQAVTALVAGLDSNRYSGMMQQLRGWHEKSPVQAEHAESEVKHYVKRARRRFERRFDAAAEQGNPDELVHDARKAAKRARYVAELAQPVLGSKARSTVKRMTAIQDRLGAQQDRTTGVSVLLEMASADLAWPTTPLDPAAGASAGNPARPRIRQRPRTWSTHASR